jgi:hypothetical protein
MTEASEVRQWSTKEASGVAAYSANLHNVDAAYFGNKRVRRI